MNSKKSYLYFFRNVLSEIRKAVTHEGDSLDTIDKKIMVALRLINTSKSDSVKEFYHRNGDDAADDIVDEVLSNLYEHEILLPCLNSKLLRDIKEVSKIQSEFNTL